VAKSIETAITIAAPKERVWAVLMDFGRYPEWNPFIRSLEGTARVGETLDVFIQPPGQKISRFRPRVVEVQSERNFAWRGALPIPGLFAGEHRFTLGDDAGGTLFRQSEGFSGLLVPFVGTILKATEAGFRSMNAALKARAEAR
jgi:hypothetical protein